MACVMQAVKPDGHNSVSASQSIALGRNQPLPPQQSFHQKPCKIPAVPASPGSLTLIKSKQPSRKNKGGEGDSGSDGTSRHNYRTVKNIN